MRSGAGLIDECRISFRSAGDAKDGSSMHFQKQVAEANKSLLSPLGSSLTSTGLLTNMKARRLVGHCNLFPHPYVVAVVSGFGFGLMGGQSMLVIRCTERERERGEKKVLET